MRYFNSLILALGLAGLTGCTVLPPSSTVTVSPVAESEKSQILTAVGYAPIETQPGATATERMLQAMQASKLEAYRELSEQLFGLQLQSVTGAVNQTQDDVVITTRVAGTVRGARVVRSYPLDDLYVTELELDPQHAPDMVSTTNSGMRRNGGSF